MCDERKNGVICVISNVMKENTDKKMCWKRK